MPLELQEFVKSDFLALSQYYGSETGDLSTPAAVICAPVSTQEEAKELNDWSLKQQLDVFEHDKTAFWLKVVDTDQNNDIISLGRWHFYDSPYEFSKYEFAGVEDPADLNSYPRFMNVALYRGLLEPLFQKRNEWMTPGQKWVLTSLSTREPYRRQGAGSLIINWGIEQARQSNCPAYLEASPAGLSTYEKCGFQKDGELMFDLEDYGLKGSFSVGKMVWMPHR